MVPVYNSKTKQELDQIYSLIRSVRKKDPIAAKKLQRKLKKKKYRDHLKNRENQPKIDISNTVKKEDTVLQDELDVIIEYVPPSINDDLTEDDDLSQTFRDVFQRFYLDENEEDEDFQETNDEGKINFTEIDENSEPEDDEGKPKMSKKKLKQMSRYTLPQLKQISKRPDVVEAWDVTSADAKLLVYLKGYRNTIPVPSHWNQKRKYMQNKRGFEKPPFQLPLFIEETKIRKIREVIQERDAHKSSKQRQREKVHPKMHRMDIDYQVLHDAFFKYATKPKMTKYGDVYYEGKEHEMKMKKYTPGVLSATLKEALGMAPNFPPPWLINMQRYGRPPRYPGLAIPGLNASIPIGAEYGYHPGGWGKPPVDEFSNPLYRICNDSSKNYNDNINKNYWGELGSDDEEEENQMNEDEKTSKSENGTTDGLATPSLSTAGESDTPLFGVEGVTTETSGLRSIVSLTSGVETPESVDLRKGTSTSTPKPYTVLPQQLIPHQHGALFSSNIGYKIPTKGNLNNVVGGGIITPDGGTFTPALGGLVTPFGGIGYIDNARGAGGVIPYLDGAGNSSVGGTGSVILPYNTNGVLTPYGLGNVSVVNPGGLITPTGMTSIGGLMTPQGNISSNVKEGSNSVTFALNPSEIEQEGVFAGDVIRKQLKRHEEIAIRTKQAAKQYEISDLYKKKGENDPESETKKKKKDKFKF